MDPLKVLSSVILSLQNGDSSMLRSREVQTVIHLIPPPINDIGYYEKLMDIQPNYEGSIEILMEVYNIYLVNSIKAMPIENLNPINCLARAIESVQHPLDKGACKEIIKSYDPSKDESSNLKTLINKAKKLVVTSTSSNFDDSK